MPAGILFFYIYWSVTILLRTIVFLYVKTEVHDVAIFNYICFTLYT